MTDSRQGRWFRFSLRRLLIAISILAIWMGWNAYKLDLRRQSEAYLATQGIGGRSAFTYGRPEKPWKSLPFGLRVLGAKPVRTIDLQQLLISPDERDYIQSLFPEADIYAPQLQPRLK
jgi:hypothetical protein